jgi:hypothetical protein
MKPRATRGGNYTAILGKGISLWSFVDLRLFDLDLQSLWSFFPLRLGGVISPQTELGVLGNEYIEIFRQTSAALRRPLMLYSIGKDSSLLLHLARNAFDPACDLDSASHPLIESSRGLAI